MKTNLLLGLLAATGLSAQPILAPIAPDALRKLQQVNPLDQFADHVVEAGGEVSPATVESIINDSTILHDGTNWTLVPKGAVIHIPDALKDRANALPGGTLLTWLDFLTRNRAWITTSEVTFAQAKGDEPLPATQLAHWATSDKMVIATLQRGPISVAQPEPTRIQP